MRGSNEADGVPVITVWIIGPLRTVGKTGGSRGTASAGAGPDRWSLMEHQPRHLESVYVESRQN